MLRQLVAARQQNRGNNLGRKIYEKSNCNTRNNKKLVLHPADQWIKRRPGIWSEAVCGADCRFEVGGAALSR